MIFCPWCTILGALPLVSLVYVQGLRPVERRGLATRNKRAKIGNEHEPQLYRELKATYDDSTDAETLFPFEFEPMDPINSEGDFVGYCKEWFLFFEEDHSNAFISQGDLIDFMVDVCTVFEGDDIPDFDCPRPTFRTISEKVQFMFVKNLCNGQEVAVCLQSVLNNGTEFGYHEDLTKSLFLEDLCCDLVQFISLVGLRKNSGCLQSPITLQIDPSSAPSPMVSSQPNGVVIAPTASPMELAPSVNSPPIDGSQPSPLPVVSLPNAPSQPVVAPGSSPSFKPTISKGPQAPTLSMEPMSGMPVMLSSSPQILPSLKPSSIHPTSFPWKSLEPTSLRIPLQPTGSTPGSDAITNGQASSNNTAVPRNNISVAAILGIVLGFGALLLLGAVSSLKQARKRDFAITVLSNTTPVDSVH